MRLSNVIRNMIGAILAGTFILMAVPANAGRLQTAAIPLPPCSDCSQQFSAVISNFGSHTEQYTLTCLTGDQAENPTGIETASIGPDVSEYNSWTVLTPGTQVTLARCELEVSGSTGNWRLLLCNYYSDNTASRHSPETTRDQCIEGR